MPLTSDPVNLTSLVGRARDSALTLVLHEDAAAPLAGVALPEDGDVLVVVGPEGGITERELQALVAAGARPVRLGPTVLRTSSAGPAALAVLNAQHRWR
jgi:16S rRNA (uracil1498-N3)-methyltransferase